jgi:hypothetical protein
MRTDQRPEPAPVACTLDASDFKARLAWIAALNTESLLDRRRDDLRLELVYAADAWDQVLRMVRDEQACCAFLTFAVHDEPGVVRVIIEVPETAREAAATIFEPFQSKTPSPRGRGCCGALESPPATAEPSR